MNFARLNFGEKMNLMLVKHQEGRKVRKEYAECGDLTMGERKSVSVIQQLVKWYYRQEKGERKAQLKWGSHTEIIWHSPSTNVKNKKKGERERNREKRNHQVGVNFGFKWERKKRRKIKKRKRDESENNSPSGRERERERGCQNTSFQCCVCS